MFADIKAYFASKKIPAFRFKQFLNAVYKNNISSFDEITVFPKALREELKEHFSLSSMFLVEAKQSADTVKFLLKTKEGFFVESVLMNHKDKRRTVCVSSQVFCAVGCKFCATGANKFEKNLSCQEIIEQVLFVNRHLKHKEEIVTNIVFMGMGEPFLNFDEVIKAIQILKDEECLGIGARHITVSTSGIVPKIYAFTDLNLHTRLAISLHAPNDKLRSELMPLNKRYPLSELMKACDYYTQQTNKRISYEYVLIGDVNDKKKHALELAGLLKGRLSHVNLLIYNPHEFASFVMPKKTDVLTFRDILQEKGIEVSIRKSMGDDISGACGQLSGKVKRKGEEEEYLKSFA
ncbi:23S rRNA (adenine(2503)-C(2))-methyltransferase RlmN [Candidatus Woesearchaeota archaeon]|nr:23S rRNA (adenine(2503)-C(2))-methyltransferase RlmN [Nanoarchaeota archaeon]MCB9370544.1 23S rRNA (adenine(2503)-C(2))-methyltransferase RlmN [Candidatus Woesearchaeota archaeon]USN43619.1 MAG: 23S rRNA (adenine(2503)-C(2))-methyltransferase RlmN [Candidatus Woesearchaeota archaeon]